MVQASLDFAGRKLVQRMGARRHRGRGLAIGGEGVVVGRAAIFQEKVILLVLFIGWRRVVRVSQEWRRPPLLRGEISLSGEVRAGTSGGEPGGRRRTLMLLR